ncbi:putative autophagy-related protein 11 [Ochlerotatus camptorhynchus]|uniref:putative autophagy-related protein 11 n=1 Tax=Ochlerotatus camptorhynchus TaxID=644619 RepID=UPI0031DBD245
MGESMDIDDVIGREDPTSRQNEDFLLRKTWVDRIVDELDENLKLFFRVMVGFRNLPNNHEREKIYLELSASVKSNEDVMVDRLNHIHTNLQCSRYTILLRYKHILKAVQNIRGMLPNGKQALQLNKRKKTMDESLQWITDILASRARIRNLTKKIHAMQSEIDETKLELFTLKDRSSREIEDITEKSELKLSAVKQSEDERFAELQEEASKKVLGLEQIEEYRDLLRERDQKRRRIIKLTVQLQQWIKQYDKFVGDPMKELKPIEEETKRFAEWKNAVYHPQKDKLKQLMVGVELMKSEQMMAQVDQFRIAHAARVLQRAWRKVLEKRKSRKKGRKGKKGKKRSQKKK